MTRTAADSVGMRLTYDNEGGLMGRTVAARAVGTTVSLRRLFSTLPVRQQVRFPTLGCALCSHRRIRGMRPRWGAQGVAMLLLCIASFYPGSTGYMNHIFWLYN